jgi:hypothetical protein
LLISDANADVGGGKGNPTTPWRLEGPKSIEHLEKVKSESAGYQTLSVPAVIAGETTADGIIHLNKVVLMPSPSIEGDEPLVELVGKTLNGEPIVVSFNQIELFTVLSKSSDTITITITVTIWPDITPRELLERQPSYKQLYEDYRSIVTPELKIASADGRLYVFMGERPQVNLTLESLPVGVIGWFYKQHPYTHNPYRFWWAIPSVANDPGYPYRSIPLL